MTPTPPLLISHLALLGLLRMAAKGEASPEVLMARCMKNATMVPVGDQAGNGNQDSGFTAESMTPPPAPSIHQLSEVVRPPTSNISNTCQVHDEPWPCRGSFACTRVLPLHQ